MRTYYLTNQLKLLLYVMYQCITSSDNNATSIEPLFFLLN